MTTPTPSAAPVPAEPSINYNRLTREFCARWSGNELVEAGDVLEWLTTQVDARPATGGTEPTDEQIDTYLRVKDEEWRKKGVDSREAVRRGLKAVLSAEGTAQAAKPAEPKGEPTADLMEAVSDLLETAPCECSHKRRYEDGEHMSGCYLFDLNLAHLAAFRAAQPSPTMTDAIAAGEPTDEQIHAIYNSIWPAWHNGPADGDVKFARAVLALRASSAGTPHGAREPADQIAACNFCLDQARKARAERDEVIAQLTALKAREPADAKDAARVPMTEEQQRAIVDDAEAKGGTVDFYYGIRSAEAFHGIGQSGKTTK